METLELLTMYAAAIILISLGYDLMIWTINKLKQIISGS